MVENENKECAPSEVLDIWQYVFIWLHLHACSKKQ